LTEDGVPKLADFGLARAIDSTAITGGGEVLGTFLYLAPEVLMGEEATPASDAWALGCVLYELLTGKLPWRYDRPEVWLYTLVNEPCPPPSSLRKEIPAALDAAVLSLLAAAPGKRASAEALRAALVAVLAHQVSASPER